MNCIAYMCTRAPHTRIYRIGKKTIIICICIRKTVYNAVRATHQVQSFCIIKTIFSQYAVPLKLFTARHVRPGPGKFYRKLKKPYKYFMHLCNLYNCLFCL